MAKVNEFVLKFLNFTPEPPNRLSSQQIDIISKNFFLIC